MSTPPPSTAVQGGGRGRAALARDGRARAAGPAHGGRQRVVAALAALLAALAVVFWVVGFTGLLGVRAVSVTGARTVPAAEIRLAAAVPDGMPLARVDPGAIAARVRAIPGVAQAWVSRAWPSTVRITVAERRPAAVAVSGGDRWLVDGGGVLFQRVAAAPARLPRLEVASPGPADRATRAALSALAALPEPVRAQLVRLSADTPDSVTLVLRDGRTVLWGSAEEAAAKARVLQALLRQPGRSYDVSTPNAVTVR